MRVLLAIAAGAVGYCYYLGAQARERRALRKDEVTRWEGEGGNVPSVATPSPAPIPARSAPAGGDPRVH